LVTMTSLLQYTTRPRSTTFDLRIS
jgi:hypothetical protein